MTQVSPPQAPPRSRTTPVVVWLVIGAAVIGALFAIDRFAPNFFAASLPTRAQDGLTLSISVLIESLPFVALGVVLSIVVQVWVPPGVIERWMPRRAWARRAVLSLLGMIVPVCECGNVPFARGLLMRGFSVPETLTFLIAAPIVNPIVIITTHQAFGFSDGILIARLVGGYLIANLIGWLYSRYPDQNGLLTDRFRETCDLVTHESGDKGRRSLAQFIIELRSVMPALVIGSAVAGAVQVLIPRDALLAIGSNPALSIVAMVTLAMIVSICSNVDAFFALSFASTFTPGSITAFLIVGPLVDVKMLALLRTTFTTRVLVGMVVVVLLAAVAIGSVVNLLRKTTSLATRWLGVGLAAILAVFTLSLALSGQLALYINPESAWFAVGMAVLVLIGSILSFALPLGAEADHGHDHGDQRRADQRRADQGRADQRAGAVHDHADGIGVDHADHDHAQSPVRSRRVSLGTVAAVTGGVVASAVAVAILVVPPASLSAEIALTRDTGAAPLFAGQDVVTLAATGDTTSFGVGEWAGVFASSPNPDSFAGDPVTLTGFVTPSKGSSGFDLTRLVITHCVIDAQPASLPIAASGSAPDTGQWVTVKGTVRATSDGQLAIDATSVEPIAEPKEPYEY